MARIAMVVFSSYPQDTRVRREAEALYSNGNSITVFCITSGNEKLIENVSGIIAHRVKLIRRRSGKFNYLYEYTFFFLATFFKMTFSCIKKKYDIIHVHNMPDFLVFTSILPKILGTKIILDLHDPTPELYSAIFNTNPNSRIIKFLYFFEKYSIKFADHVLAPNIAFKKLFISRGCPENKISIIMNSPDENIFKQDLVPSASPPTSDRFTMMYHGTIVERHGLDLAVEAVAVLKDKIPKLLFNIYGDGPFLTEVQSMIKRLKVEDNVKVLGVLIVDKIAAVIPNIDLGIIPNRINSFTQINFPVRIFEYLVYNKPVLVPRTEGIKDYFGEDSIFYFNKESSYDLANSIYELYSNQEKKQNILNRAVRVFENHRWEKQKQNLFKTYKNLLS